MPGHWMVSSNMSLIIISESVREGSRRGVIVNPFGEVARYHGGVGRMWGVSEVCCVWKCVCTPKNISMGSVVTALSCFGTWKRCGEDRACVGGETALIFKAFVVLFEVGVARCVDSELSVQGSGFRGLVEEVS
jgi:hypothetical protein